MNKKIGFIALIMVAFSIHSFAQTLDVNGVNKKTVKKKKKVVHTAPVPGNHPNMMGGNTNNNSTPAPDSKDNKIHGGGGTPTPVNPNGNGNGGSNPIVDITQGAAAEAIKQALTNGITNAVKAVAVENGYFGNAAIKIPLPQEAQVMEEGLRMVGAGSLVDNIVMTINRSAESAAVKAAPIFLNSITQLTVPDAINIVSGAQQDAATQFLQRTTTNDLVTAFKPSIQSALDATYATKYWTQAVDQYNKLPFVSAINPDLCDFVTRKAISGLFYMIAQEEAKIRQNPTFRTTPTLKKVFGSVVPR